MRRRNRPPAHQAANEDASRAMMHVATTTAAFALRPSPTFGCRPSSSLPRPPSRRSPRPPLIPYGAYHSCPAEPAEHTPRCSPLTPDAVRGSRSTGPTCRLRLTGPARCTRPTTVLDAPNDAGRPCSTARAVRAQWRLRTAPKGAPRFRPTAVSDHAQRLAPLAPHLAAHAQWRPPLALNGARRLRPMTLAARSPPARSPSRSLFPSDVRRWSPNRDARWCLFVAPNVPSACGHAPFAPNDACERRPSVPATRLTAFAAYQ
jgi:hypothetical protein